MSMTKRGATTGLTSLIYMGLLIVAIGIANLIAARSSARIDLTHDQRFTLSDASITTSESLPGEVSVEVYMSDNLPPQLEQMRRDLNDLLAEYAAYSNGSLVYEFIDPDASDEFQERANALDLPQWPLEQRSEDEISRRFVYAGIAFVYDDGGEEHTETIPQILPGMNYEYELTRSLRAVVRDEGPARLGIATGDGSMFDPLLEVPFNPQQPVSREDVESQYLEQIATLFDGLYEFVFVDVTGDPIADDIDGLLMLGPTAEFTDEMRRNLDQFIMSGRPVALFVSPYKMEELQFDQPGFQGVTVPAANETGLAEMLEHYGVRLRQDAIFDFNSAQVSAEQRQIDLGGLRGTTWLPYLDPKLPELTEMSESSVLVPNMNLIAFLPLNRQRPLSTSSLTLTADATEAMNDGSLRVNHVIRTSGRSYRLEADDANRYESLGDDVLRPYAEEACEAGNESACVWLTRLCENGERAVCDWLRRFSQTEFEPNEDAEIDLASGPFTVAMTLEGHLTSAVDAAEDDADHLSETDDGRLFVVSNGYWVQAFLTQQDPLLGRGAMLPGRVRGTIQQYHASNILLLRNTADWLAQQSDLVQIRARGQAAFFDAGELTDGDKRFYKIFNILGVPAIFCFLGLVGFLVRQSRRASISQAYGTDR